MAEVLDNPAATTAQIPPTILGEEPTTLDDNAAADTTSPDALTTPDPSTALTTTNSDNTLAPSTKKTKTILRKKRRPARVQIDPSTIKSEPPPQTGTIFNIWYNKWSGGDRDDAAASQTPAPGRVSISRDSGFTRADGVSGAFFCLFFSRGVCPKGRECEYLHRLPDGGGGRWDAWSGNVDCFGRDKHSDYRDDMGGVGSFTRQNRTLYVGRIHPTGGVEEVVARHFSEFGPIERIRCLPARGVAFVTYKTEALAQFAKEAMAHQALDSEEVLNVRWATVDPNPASQKREARAIEEQAAEAVRRVLPKGVVEGLVGGGAGGGWDEREAKRRRMADDFGLEGYEAPEKVYLENQKALERAGAARGLLEEQADDDGQGEQEVQQGGHEESAVDEKTDGADGRGGIFGSSTLAALRDYEPDRSTARVELKSGGAAKGPLVGYGSDDDSD